MSDRRMDDHPEPFDFDALDPDWDHVPKELRDRDGEQVELVTVEGERLSGTLIIFPEDFAAAARKRKERPSGVTNCGPDRASRGSVPPNGMKATATITAALLTGALALAACGGATRKTHRAPSASTSGSSTHADKPTKAEYVQELDALCQRTDDESAATERH